MNEKKSTHTITNIERYRNDPWAFLTEVCYTKDQTDKKTPIKLMPQYPYLRLYVKLWVKNKKLAVPKSRRMTMSWVNIALYLWDTMFNPVRDNAFVSKKEDDATDLVRRAEFIFDHIPEDKIPRALLPRKETRAKPAALIFPDLDSKIQGFPMGADQLRSYGFSGILGDECAFWDEAQKFYTSAAPTIEGGGRMSLISSRSPGFFQRLVYDQLDNSDPIDETQTPEQKRPLKDDSVILWVNPKNKFVVFDLHYTAHPGKREPGFAEAIKNSMPIKDFMVEYERNWEAFEGKPVYEDYSKLRHEVQYSLEPHLGLPLLCGWDFGLTPACIVAQLRGQTLFILREFVAEHASIKKFAPQTMAQIKQYYPEWQDARKDFIHYIDPAGLSGAQTDGRSCAQEMYDQGIRNINPGPLNWEPRRKAVEHFLMLQTREGAGLQVHPAHCPTLTRGFAGGYRYPEKYRDLEPGKISPIKNNYSHPHDALQYLCGGAQLLLQKKGAVNIATPEYFLAGKPDLSKRKQEGYNFG